MPRQIDITALRLDRREAAQLERLRSELVGLQRRFDELSKTHAALQTVAGRMERELWAARRRIKELEAVDE